MKDLKKHPKGTKANILLTSVFGPYAVDSEKYGLAKPMELPDFHFSRGQGPFSIRVFSNSDGLLLIQANIDAPCTVLDFPSEKRFINEIRKYKYDIIGISSVLVNVQKVKRMCELIRRYSPYSVVVIGSYIAMVEDIEKIISADHIVRGDGVKWFRKYLGQDTTTKLRHPIVPSGFGTRMFGIPLYRFRSLDRNSALIFGTAGCPIGCDFCTTSAQFGGKGKCVKFYETADELFSIMDQIYKKRNIRSFSFTDPNFFIDEDKVRRLIELMEKHNRPWEFFALGSINVMSKFSMEDLVKSGLHLTFLGIEDKHSKYSKNKGVDTVEVVKRFRSHGISVIGAMIFGLEHHSDENFDEIIDTAVSHDADFHQFALLIAGPGSRLYDKYKKEKKLVEDYPIDNWHSHDLLNFHHDKITRGKENYFIEKAFVEDYKRNGPCVTRVIETRFNRWKRYKDHPNRLIRTRTRLDKTAHTWVYPAAVYAARRYFKKDPHRFRKMDRLLKKYYKEFGLLSKLSAACLGRVIYFFLKREERRRNKGITYEPWTWLIQNKQAARVYPRKKAVIAEYVVPKNTG